MLLNLIIDHNLEPILLIPTLVALEVVTKIFAKDESMALKTDDLFPGSKISVDHFVSNPPGRLLNTYGKEKVDDKYKGGCIFVDHATGYTHVELQSKHAYVYWNS